MKASSFSFSPFLAFAAAFLAVVLGAGALTVPWLTVRGSIGAGGGQAGDRPTAGEDAGGIPSSLRPILLVTPEATPPRPKFASSAPALTSPAPDPPSVLALQQRLRALTYRVGPEDGTLSPATRFALTAFQKVEGLPPTGQPDAPTLSRLDTAQPPAPAYTTPPDHLEVDIRRQVVFIVRGGRVSDTVTTSTGNGKVFRSEGRRSRAVTPNGQFAITYKRNGWRRSPLGLLYRPAYFNGGIAFHGAKSVPTSPASHGCVRLPMQFADWFADNTPVGMVVYVYGNPGQPNPPAVAAAAPPGPPALPPPPEGAPPPPEIVPPSSGEPPPAQAPAPVLEGILGGG